MLKNTSAFQGNLNMSFDKKVLFIQFKFLGDVIFLTPIIKAYRYKFPNEEIHVLVSKEAAPLLSNLDFIDKVWAFPRVRGKLNLLTTIKFLMKLRSLNFDLSIDFAGNDRGSLFTSLISAKKSIGPVRSASNFIQKFAYKIRVNTDFFPPSYIDFNKQIIQKGLKFKFPLMLPEMEISPDPTALLLVKKNIVENFILCHVSTTQEKKQWALDNWVDLFNLCEKSKIALLFSAGPSLEEQLFLKELKKKIPKAKILKPINDIKIFIAFLSRVELLISNDSAPLHCAAAMKVKIIGLFGPADSVRRAAPIYSSFQKLIGKKCECLDDLGREHFCSSKSKCIDTIKAKDVLYLIKKQLKKPTVCI